MGVLAPVSMYRQTNSSGLSSLIFKLEQGKCVRPAELLTLTLATVTKFQEGVVLGFKIFAVAPK